MFIDRAKINIKAGNGGNGCISFYRAKYITNGGPDGGDGGKGGDIIFEATDNMHTLLDFRYKRKYHAENGQDGGKNNCSGANASSIVIKVPVGTVVKEETSGKVVADMNKNGERRILIHGGRGGKGNQHFATPTRQAPRYAQPGKLAKELDVVLELKLMADVCLIGPPNVGKSSLLAMVTNANPKIANYHFTTLSPNLGVVRGNWGNDFVMADIPGIIEGAHEGAGLGHEFLRHVERTKVLIHVIDAASIEGDDPIEKFEKLNNELREYSEKLLERPQIVAANKTDLMGDDSEELNRIIKKLNEMGYEVFPVSAATGAGIEELITCAAKLLKDVPDVVFDQEFDPYEEVPEDHKVFEVIKHDDDYFEVVGKGVEKMFGYTNIDTEKGMAFFQNYIRENGIVAELENQGAKDGDTVRIYDLEFEYFK